MMRSTTMPSVTDLAVYRAGPDTLSVSSHLTRGRCATVYMFGIVPGHRQIVPFLIPSYMQGITTALIDQAVTLFLEREAS